MLRTWIWRDFANITLGLWLMAGPLTYTYGNRAMAVSDVVTGSIVVVLATMTLWPRFDLARWGICLSGIWLLFAPLIFWTRDAGVYAQNTFIGALLIAFSVLIPMMPSRAHHAVMMTRGPDTPPGWSYNPSDWYQRGPIIAMAFVGFFLSRHLAAFQLGHVSFAWDPWFGDGTRRVLESEVSKAWPVSDAGLGAVSYLLEALSGFMGGRNRWRTMPWMVLMFGVLVIPLGVVSIGLVMLQPVSVGAWCGLCLVTAAAMLIMISPAVDEVVAMGQFLLAARAEGKPFWQVFWIGGTLDRASGGSASEGPQEHTSAVARVVSALDLRHVPMTLLLATAIGVWLMAAPTVLQLDGPFADSHYISGALVITWSVIAFGEVARPARLLNIPVAVWIAVAPFCVSGGGSGAAIWLSLIVALSLVGVSLPRGRIETSFASWNRYLV